MPKGKRDFQFFRTLVRSLCGVVETELRGLATAPMVDLQPTGKVEAPPSVSGDLRTERRVESAKGNGVKSSAQAVADGHFQMP